jgi:hypothetical protein
LAMRLGERVFDDISKVERTMRDINTPISQNRRCWN